MTKTVITSEQRQAAFAWAEGFRSRRGRLRQDLGDGTTTLDRVLADAAAGSGDLGAVRLLFVLESLPGAGKVATRRRLAELGLAESVAIRDLDATGRDALLAAFGGAG